MAALIATAETARDVGSALNLFLTPVDDYATEITELIAQCFSTSSALRKLGNAINEYRDPRRNQLVAADVNTVRTSLDHTFSDVRTHIGRLGRAPAPVAAYRRVWETLSEHFYAQSRNTLKRRLQYYQVFLDELTNTFFEGAPRDYGNFNDVRYMIEHLLDSQEQEHPLVNDLQRVSLVAHPILRPPSFERERPTQPRLPPRGAAPRGYGGHEAPQMGPGFDPRRSRPPPAPEVPGSPTTASTTNTSSSNQSSNAPSLAGHWLPRVFKQTCSTTAFDPTGQSSISLGTDQGPETSQKLAEGYDRLLDMSFDNGDLLVQLHQRRTDLRARFLCRTLRPTRSHKCCCQPLVYLDVQRSRSLLRFILVNKSDRLDPQWAILKFPSYEKLVLFFCSFLALRSEDSKSPVSKVADSVLHGEELLYGGRIVDDYFQHALRLYRDKHSNGIRLQASVMSGPLKRVPVWTAFITHQVQSSTWMTRHGSKAVHLRDLQRYIFNDEYKPQMAPTGEHELTFETSNDAKEFMRAIDRLA